MDINNYPTPKIIEDSIYTPADPTPDVESENEINTEYAFTELDKIYWKNYKEIVAKLGELKNV